MSDSIETVDQENAPTNSNPIGRGTEVSGQLKPLVLLHGWGASPAVWQPLIAVLNTRCPELEIINLSWPGYGDEPALVQADNLNELAEIMLPKLPLDAHWLGWSLGGNLALWLAEFLAQQSQSNKQAAANQAVENQTAGNEAAQSHTGQLIMLGSNASFAQREHWSEALSAEVLEQFRQGFDQVPEKTLKRFHGLQMQGESDLRGCKKAFTAQVGKEMPADNATLAAGLKWLAELDLTGLNLTKLDLTESAQPQSSRLHWLLGEHDPLVPVTVAEQLPGQVEVLSDCGHLPMLTQSEVLAEHLLSIIKAADDEQ